MPEPILGSKALNKGDSIMDEFDHFASRVLDTLGIFIDDGAILRYCTARRDEMNQLSDEDIVVFVLDFTFTYSRYAAKDDPLLSKPLESLLIDVYNKNPETFKNRYYLFIKHSPFTYSNGELASEEKWKLSAAKFIYNYDYWVKRKPFSEIPLDIKDLEHWRQWSMTFDQSKFEAEMKAEDELYKDDSD